MARCELFIFDLAGTTVVDDDHVLRSFLRTAAAFDLVVNREALQACMGWHKARVFQTLLEQAGRDPSAADAMARQFEVEFAQLVEREPLRPTAGALATLAALADAGVQIAFNTGFSRVTAEVVIGSMGWERWPTVASDEVASGRPAPDMILRAMELVGAVEPERVGVAGDTPADLGAGSAAGVGWVVGVGCGTHTLDELRPFAPTHLLPDLAGLPGLVLADG